MFKLAILILVFLSFILRIFFIFQGAVSFHYDMSRDAYEAQQIWKEHNLKILGPPTSTPGLYHGVFYYYLVAPFYALGDGDPRVVAVFLSFLSSLTIIPIMLLVQDLFKSTKWAILAGLLFALSFEAIQYGPWLSDPAPALLTNALFFYFLRLWQKGKRWGLYLVTSMAALSTQFEFFFLYLFVILFIFKFFFEIKVYPKDLLLSFLAGLLGLSSFLIATIKFKSLLIVIGGFSNILNSGQIDFRPLFTEQFLNYLNTLSDLFTNNFFPSNAFLGGLLMFAVLYYIRKEKFILFCLLSNLPIFIFGGHTNAYVNAGLILPALLGLIVLMSHQRKEFNFLLVGLILISNLLVTFKYSPQGQIILVIPNDMSLKNELSLIDETYRLANKKPFSINTLTLPLWTNTTWAYLYSWYGKNKYGYVPSFYGHDQIGLLGANELQKINKPLEKTFFIIEPNEGISPELFQQELDTENSKTKFLNEISFSSLKLQVRSPKNNE